MNEFFSCIAKSVVVRGILYPSISFFNWVRGQAFIELRGWEEEFSHSLRSSPDVFFPIPLTQLSSSRFFIFPKILRIFFFSVLGLCRNSWPLVCIRFSNRNFMLCMPIPGDWAACLLRWCKWSQWFLLADPNIFYWKAHWVFKANRTNFKECKKVTTVKLVRLEAFLSSFSA